MTTRRTFSGLIRLAAVRATSVPVRIAVCGAGAEGDSSEGSGGDAGPEWPGTSRQ